MIRSEESGGSSSGSHSRHTESEESVVEDPVETYDIEEVVEPADTNPEPKEILLAKVHFHVSTFFIKLRNNEQYYRIFDWVEQVFTVSQPEVLFLSQHNAYLLCVGESKLQTTEK